MPKEFIPAFTSLAMQGGLLASLSTGLVNPRAVEVAPGTAQLDSDHYNIDELLTQYKVRSNNNFSTQVRTEGNMLYFNAQLDMELLGNISTVDNTVFGHERLSAEVAIDLSKGVDSTGMPNSITVTKVGKDSVQS